MQIACALISTWGATGLTGCGDGLYSPNYVHNRPDALRPDVAADGGSEAFVSGPDAADTQMAADVRVSSTAKVGLDRVDISQGGATLKFEDGSFDDPSDVTVRQMTWQEARVRGPFNPVFELTFSRGQPKFKPSIEIHLRDLLDEQGENVVAVGASLVLARLKPLEGVDKAQWIRIPNSTLVETDPLDSKLVGKPFDFIPDEGSKSMVIGVLLNCFPPANSCVSKGISCEKWCAQRGNGLGCGTGGLCQ